MLSNYLKIAFRSIRRHPGYSAINIGGLAIGLASCILIMLFVFDEWSFDRFNEDYDRLYRVVEVETNPEGVEEHAAYTAGTVGPALVRDMPEVEQSVRMAGRHTIGRRTLIKGQNRFYEEHYFFTEPAFFEMFDFSWIQGDPTTALSEPSSIVLTRKAATQYFGEENPVGESMFFEQFGDLRVTGVLENPPRNSHLDFNFLVSFATLENIEEWTSWLATWDSEAILTYVRLRDADDASALAAKVPAFTDRYQAEEFGLTRSIYLQPLSDIHFNSAHIDWEVNWRESNIAYVYILSAIALFLLLIGCVNYINLATARAMNRAHEIGVRKALGAFREQLAGQFLGESGLFTMLAATMAVALVLLALPFFNQLTDKHIDLHLSTSGVVWIGILVLLLIAGFLTGGYPAYYLARFKPARVLKGQFKTGATAVRVRQVLVVAQFALSIALIIGTFVITKQLSYIQDKQLGYNEEELIAIDINSGNARANFESMKRELGAAASVQRVSVTSNIPGDWKDIPQIEVVAPETSADASYSMRYIGADSEFLSTFEIELAAGRNFSDAFSTDSTAVLLNEAAARLLNISEPAGQILSIPRGLSGTVSAEPDLQVRVVGIVRDFHISSLHEPIAPLVLGYWSNPLDVIDYFTVRIQSENLESTLAHLRLVGERYDPEHPFEYNFLDDRLNDFYQSENRVSFLVSMAAGLAVFLACLGLLGLAAFSAEQRIKEIGIRKVLGASVPGIIRLMTKDFLTLVVVAFFVGAPLAYLGMNQWLQTFAYRTQIGFGTLVLALVLSVAVAFAMVFYLSLRAALSNPVEALRYE